MSSTIVTIRAAAFTGDRTRNHRCAVDIDGTVRVWDATAGHYTVCHALSPRDEARAVRKARAARRAA